MRVLAHLNRQEVKMRKKSGPQQPLAASVLKDIHCRTPKQHSSEEKIRIALSGLRGENGIALPPKDFADLLTGDASTRTSRSQPNVFRYNGRIPDLLCGSKPTVLQEWKLTFSSREFRDQYCIAA